MEKMAAARKPDREYKKLITYVKDRPGHDRRYAIDCDKIKNDLGWRQSYDFASGSIKPCGGTLTTSLGSTISGAAITNSGCGRTMCSVKASRVPSRHVEFSRWELDAHNQEDQAVWYFCDRPHPPVLCDMGVFGALRVLCPQSCAHLGSCGRVFSGNADLDGYFLYDGETFFCIDALTSIPSSQA